jgi:hypothetical protein
MRFDVRTFPVCQLIGGELQQDVSVSVLLEDFATFMTSYQLSSARAQATGICVVRYLLDRHCPSADKSYVNICFGRSSALEVSCRVTHSPL